MKIAVATIKKDENSEVSTQAGRAPYYLIFNEKAELIETLNNPFSHGGGGAGFGVAKMLSDEDVDAVVAGKIGENMVGALKERGIKYYEIDGIAKEVPSKITEIEKQE
jgi:predicted Fe-Mo cluster-binding NifX family protein